MLDRRIELVVCPHLLAELGGVLERPKFRRYVTVAEAQTFVAEVARLARRFGDPTEPPSASRDPNDDYLVALTNIAGARALISGDRDLTEMPDTGVVVLTPKRAVEQLL